MCLIGNGDIDVDEADEISHEERCEEVIGGVGEGVERCSSLWLWRWLEVLRG